MQGYAAAFAVAAICSLMFIGDSVEASVNKIGKIAVAVFAVLFIGTEILALFS
jgi:hypothetical protein